MTSFFPPWYDVIVCCCREDGGAARAAAAADRGEAAGPDRGGGHRVLGESNLTAQGRGFGDVNVRFISVFPQNAKAHFSVLRPSA